jgi:hypothetical protein
MASEMPRRNRGIALNHFKFRFAFVRFIMQSAFAIQDSRDVVETLVLNPLLVTLYRYWRSLAPAGEVPRKCAFNPIDLPGAVWPRIFLLDILEGRQNYRVRLLGTYLVDACGRDLTGLHLVESEIPRIERSATWRMLPALVVEREPQYYFGPTSFRFGDVYQRIEQILMPLADDYGDVRYALGGLDFLEFCHAPRFKLANKS